MDDVQDQTILTPKIDETSGEGSGASILLNLESMIKSNLSSIDRIKEEIDKKQGMLDDILNNDPTYKQHCDNAKEAGKIKSATKQQLLKQPQAADLANRVQTLRSELKEIQGGLSDYLKEYQRMSGTNEIEGDDGEVREIVYTAKLIKKFERR